MKILVGADPELFVRKNNQFVSAHGMIQGTKYEPFKVPNGAVQIDGMALEFNIDPAATAQEFFDNIQSVRDTMQRMVPGYEVVCDPVAIFDQGYFDTVPEEAKELGCEPDFCAYTGEANPRPDNTQPMRTASGHIHIGWTEGVDIRSSNHTSDCHSVVKQLDYALGIYSLLWDPDNRRRSMYGKAGAYRPKSYGVEYRVLSNRWLSDPRLIHWVYSAVQQAMADLSNGVKYFEQHGDETARQIIDTNEIDWPSKYRFGLPIATPPGLKSLKVA